MSDPISDQHHQIDIPNCASNTSPSIKLPRTNLVGVRDDYNEICVPLYKALTTGDWEKAQAIIDKRREVLRCSISENYETPLHIAVSVRRLGVDHNELLLQQQRQQLQGKDFVEKLVSSMQRDDLELQNGNGETALHIAAVRGDVEMAKVMVKKNEALLTIPNSQGRMPLSIAALYGKHENMVEYLYDTCEKMTHTSCWTHEKRDYVLLRCIEAELFDIALRIVKDHKELAENPEALRILARKPRLFQKKYIFIRGIRIQATTFPPVVLRIWGIIGPELELLRIIWSSILKLNKEEISDILRGPPDPPIEQLTTTRSNNIEKCAAIRPLDSAAAAPKRTTYSSQMLFVAAECGNEKFLFELIREYPELIWKVNCDNNQSLFHVAVTHRRGRIFSMLKSIAGSIKDSIVSFEDKKGNNILHLAGERPKSDRLKNVPGVVLRMQHELIWFTEVEAIVPCYLREKKNKAGLTPREVFKENHNDLVSKGEKWMKQVAPHVMVVSTLIATIACALPFSVPGGFHQEKGTPIFIHQKLFTVLVILDALSLILASTSLIYVMDILLSSYAESDFKRSLPSKLLPCLENLYQASITMTSTFVIAIFLLYQNKSLGVPISVAVTAFCLWYISPQKTLIPFQKAEWDARHGV